MEEKRPLIIFDFNGTLVELKVNWSGAIERLTGLLEGNSISVVSGPGLTHRILDAIDRLESPQKEVLAREARSIINQEELSGISTVRLKPNCIEVVSGLSADFDLAIASNNGSRVIAATLRRVGPSEDYFKVIMSRDTAKPKPDPDQYLKILETLGSKTVYVVGDFPADIFAVHNSRTVVGGSVSITAIGLSGSLGVKAISEPKPDFIINDISELSGIVRRGTGSIQTRQKRHI